MGSNPNRPTGIYKRIINKMSKTQASLQVRMSYVSETETGFSVFSGNNTFIDELMTLPEAIVCCLLSEVVPKYDLAALMRAVNETRDPKVWNGEELEPPQLADVEFKICKHGYFLGAQSGLVGFFGPTIPMIYNYSMIDMMYRIIGIYFPKSEAFIRAICRD